MDCSLPPFARRIAITVRAVETLVRPGALRRTAASGNFLVPQFQTAVGAMIHATPVVEALAAVLPGANIVVAGEDLAREVYAGNPHVSCVLAMPSPLKDFAGALRAVRARRIFGGEAYTTLLTAGNERTRVTLWSLFGGASRRVGFAVIPELVQEPLTWDPAGSQISNNLRLVEAVGLQARLTELRMYVTPEETATAEERLSALGSGAGGLRIALVTQTSPTQRKQWREDRWVTLANTLIERYQADLIFVGTGSESAKIDELRAKIPHRTISVAGRTGIAELAAIFTRCNFGITLDTGPLHVGRAVGLPMVIIAPAWSPVYEWLPVGDSRYTILKNADFVPPPPDDYIIDEVTVNNVLAAVDAWMEKSAVSQTGV